MSNARRLIAGVSVPALALSSVLAAGPATAAAESVPAVSPASVQQVTPARVEGADRYATAAELAALSHPNGASTALLARGGDFADALAAAPLAGQADAPVLLTERGRLTPRTQQALRALGVENVYVLGGTDAVSQDVETALRQAGYDVARLAGATRYGTAAAIARETARLGDVFQSAGREPTAFLALGTSFEDALAAGPAAASRSAIPILLTAKDRLPAETRQGLQALGIGYVYVVGGPLAVPEAIVREVDRMGIAVRRLAGPTAQATATAIAQEFVGSGKLSGQVTVLARGDDFADALTAGPYAARAGGPVLLTVDTTTLGDATRGYLQDPPGGIDVLRAVGGPVAIAPAVLEAAVQAVESGPQPPPTGQAFIVGPQQPRTTGVPGVVQFSVLGTYADQPLPATLDLALFPCRQADVVGSQPVTFRDADGDRLADGFGSTDTGNAAIATLNGTDVPDEKVKQDVIVRDGRITIRIAAVSGPDCAVPVVFHDENANGRLDVEASGQAARPVEPFGVGKVTFQTATGEDDVQCTAEADGYRVSYPSAWRTNDPSRSEPCRFFHPEPFVVPHATEATHIAVSITFTSADFDRLTTDVVQSPAGADILSTRSATVGGRPALRVHARARGVSLLPDGTETVTWYVDFGSRTMTAGTSSVAEDVAFPRAVEVLDRMMRTMETVDRRAECSAAELSPEPVEQPGLPTPVRDVRQRIVAAAVACDYHRLGQLASSGSGRFTYSFGDDGDPAEYWRRQEASGAAPLRFLVEVLRRPPGRVQHHGDVQHVWPSAFAYADWGSVPEPDKRALLPLYTQEDFQQFELFGGYTGHRVGIAPDGDWLFFVAGD